MGENITLTAADGHSFTAYEAGVPGNPGLVVVQEIFGLNGHIRAVCDEFAADGFHVIAPALFDRARRGAELGYTAEDVKEGLALRAAFDPAGAIADLRACAAALGSDRKGIIGYCWGGLLAWNCATQTQDFAVAVSWYGGGIAAHLDTPSHCPVQLHFGAEDGAIPLSDVDAIRAAQPDIDIFVYDGAGHGFGCPQRPSFNAEATELARTRSLAFLREHLEG